jgi:hypothetical protein
MKGSTIFWVAVGVAVYSYAWYALVSNWGGLDEEARASYLLVLLIPKIGYLWYDFLTSFGATSSSGKVIGPFTLIAWVLPRFNKFLDKHFGL